MDLLSPDTLNPSYTHTIPCQGFGSHWSLHVPTTSTCNVPTVQGGRILDHLPPSKAHLLCHRFLAAQGVAKVQPAGTDIMKVDLAFFWTLATKLTFSYKRLQHVRHVKSISSKGIP